ncbi:WD domain-containing protein [Protomyces lactucae-debilis]|uniref:WD domain-containing protein n=1 Tax=Protomyces lactucae-debilis TaxID=2754530 RepID=A0A1Y2FD72_PROLT|nr:WD domain-containing protein [Protomyces lactucae-debilis]ORY81873.1 WD domain-containing protein [Protomyces lactucae-debilis]
MVKSYTRYELEHVFGVVVSTQSNAIFLADPKAGASSGRAVVAALERVIVWDVKKGEKLMSWIDPDCKAEVTQMAQSPADQDIFAVGYSDGSIRLWTMASGQLIVTLNGHRSAITSLAFDLDGMRLASGSRDTNIVLWDVIAEVGITRLKGHRDQITALLFLEVDGASHLLSTSKDAFLKLWDLTTSHAVETHTAHRGETWALAQSPDGSTLATAGQDGELKLWSINAKAQPANNEKVFACLGSLPRQSKARPVTLAYHASGSYLAIQGADKAVEIFRIRPADELEKLLKRRRKRLAAKDKAEQETAEIKFDDKHVSYVTLRSSHKIRSICWSPSPNLTLLCALHNNSLEVYTIPPAESLSSKHEVPEYIKAHALELPGHQAEVRTLTLSSANDILATGSDGLLKLWNINSGACIRTIECGYCLALTFILQDRYIVAATKEGKLQLFDIASSTLVETLDAHEGAVWSLQVHPDGRTLVTGSADKTVKFWRFETTQVDVVGTTRQTQRLTLKHAKTLKLTDDVLSVRFSPDAKLLAVALLDATVKVFFADTLKFFLSLYGHKLPVLNMDVSSDSKMLVTCSADKNVKLWGLDFGDCHKSIFAHNDAILQVAFEQEGHNFFTSGRDKKINYWDGDRFENILRLDGHHGEVAAMAVSGDSEFVVSSGHDCSIRVWRQSDDPVFLEEEREKEMEEIYEDQLADSLQRTEMNEMTDEGEEAGRAGQATTETLTAGEKIIEALEICEADRLMMLEYERQKVHRPAMTVPQRSPVLHVLNVSAERHLLNICQAVKPSHLEDALLILPFDKVSTFLIFLDSWARHAWNMPLTTKILMVLIRMHHAQIVANQLMRPMLDAVRTHLRQALQRQKDLMGFNLAALGFLQRDHAANTQTDFEEPVEQPVKRAFATIS